MRSLVNCNELFPWQGNYPALNTLFNPYYNNKLDNTIPLVNVLESIKHYDLEMAVPGKSRDDFKIKIDDHHVLTISMEKSEEKNEKEGEKWKRKEFNYSSFSRSIPLPSNVNVSQVKASYVNGLLKIFLPKLDIMKPSLAQEVKVS